MSVWAQGAVVVALTSALLACGGSPEPRRRVVVIAVDGASNKVIAPLIAQGELPTFAALRREGVSGALRPGRPLLSPRIWTTVATGKRPDKHGIEDWVREGGGGEYRLFLSSDRRVHAVWNIASAAGKRVAVLNWLNTHPPEVVNGVMVGDHAIEGMLESRREFGELLVGGEAPVRATALDVPYAYPPDWIEQVERAKSAAEPLTSVANPFGGDDLEIYTYMRDVFDQDTLATRLALHAFDSIDPDLLMVYLPGIDRVSHFLWDTIEPSAPPANETDAYFRKKKQAELFDYYRHVDQLIGRVLARLGPDDLVLVLSDHGFEASEPRKPPGYHESEAARNGILYARGAGLRPGSAAGTLQTADVTPTILAWLGLPPARDMDGKVAAFVTAALPSPDRAPEPVASYDVGPIERLGSGTSPAEGEILENLKSLGYVD